MFVSLKNAFKIDWSIYINISKVLWSTLEFRTALPQPEFFSVNLLTRQTYSYRGKGKRLSMEGPTVKGGHWEELRGTLSGGHGRWTCEVTPLTPTPPMHLLHMVMMAASPTAQAWQPAPPSSPRQNGFPVLWLPLLPLIYFTLLAQAVEGCQWGRRGRKEFGNRKTWRRHFR